PAAEYDEVYETPQIAPDVRPTRGGAGREERYEDYASGDERRPMGLLRRIAKGLARAEDEDEGYEAPVPQTRPERRRAQAALPAPREERRRPAPQPDDAYMDEATDAAPAPRRARPAAEAAPRRPRADAEPASRTRPAARAADEDQLEIPAFLRRQAN
ncbi:MAG: hypothetical protein AAGF49_14875, partial [Pseudomonadota bacterium]